MAARRRARFQADDLGPVTYVTAGSPAALDFGLPGAVQCVSCGAAISHVYVTDVGPLGGDCLATITGDNTTRAAVRSLVTKLRSLPWADLHRFEVERDARGVTCVRARWRESARTYVIWCGGLVADIAASIVQDRLDAWTTKSGWTRQPVNLASHGR